MHKLDHIVLGAFTLEHGTSYLENKLQIKLSDVGYHNEMGTHNRVVKISKSIYLELIAVDPNNVTPKTKRWFNLDSPKLQSQLRKSPQVIGYVIEANNTKILKYYHPFFRASRDKYKWQFAIPNNKSNKLDDQYLRNGIVPSLINWESDKPINKMQDNHLYLENIQIISKKNQLTYKKFKNSFGDIEKLIFLISSQNDDLHIEDYPKLKINIKDKIRDLVITL